MNNQSLPVLRLGDVGSFKSGNSLPNGENFDGQVDGFLLLKVSNLNRSENIPLIKIAGTWYSS